MNETGIKFLDKLYANLYMSDQVQHTKDNKDNRYQAIQKYLDRLERVHIKADTESKKNHLKRLYFDKYVIKEENVSIDADANQVISAQKKTLSMWIDYLSDPTTSYPMWAKYWAFQGMLKMGSYDEFNGKYLKRDKKTIAPFVDPNPEIIAKSIDAIIKLANEVEINIDIKENLSKTDSFSKIYTIFEKQWKKNTIYRSNSTEGIWIKYNQGSKDDAIKLCKSLENKNTGWCTANESTAIAQVCGYQEDSDEDDYVYENGGDFYVYYSKDKNENYSIPRIAIRCEGHTKIGEIRGVEEGQNLEGQLVDILGSKLKEMEFLDEKSVKKNLEKVNDLIELSKIIQKVTNNIPLSSLEVNNLYSKDYGFGWEEDPRVEKTIKMRNITEDFNILSDDIRKKIVCLQKLPKSFKIDDEIFLKDAIEQNFKAFRYSSDRLLDDEEFVNFSLLSGNRYGDRYGRGNIALEDFGLISKRLLDNERIVKLIIRINYEGFQFASDRLKDDEEFVSSGILNNRLEKNKAREIFAYASDRLKDDKEFILRFNMEHDIQLLQYASDRLKDDKEVVLGAVKKDSTQLQYASDRLKDDEEVVLEAVKKDGTQLQYASDRLKDNEVIVCEALRNNERRVLLYASDRLKDDKKFILGLFTEKEMGGINILDTSERLRNDEEVIICSLKNAGRHMDWIYNHISPEMQKKPEIKLLVADINKNQRKMMRERNIASLLNEKNTEENINKKIEENDFGK